MLREHWDVGSEQAGREGKCHTEGQFCLPPLPSPFPLGPSQTTPGCWALGWVSVHLRDPTWPCLEWRWQQSAHKPHRALCCSPPPGISLQYAPSAPSEDAQSASAFVCLKQDGGTGLSPLLAGTSHVAEAFCPSLVFTSTPRERRAPSCAVTSLCFPEGPVPVSWGPFGSCPPSPAHSLSASLSFPPCPPTCLF